MKFLKSLFLYFISGITICLFWGKIIKNFGLFGGWIAGFILVGPLWYTLHYKNYVSNRNGNIFVDMALAIAICTATSSIFSQRIDFFSAVKASIPTFFLLCLGAICGVVFSILCENSLLQKTKNWRKK